MKKKLILALTIVSLCINSVACSKTTTNDTNNTVIESTENTESETNETLDEDLGDITASISLGDTITVNGSGATVNNNTVTISNGGTYSISGTSSNSQIIVDSASEENVYLVLNNVDLTCTNSAPIYVKSAKNAIIVLPDNSENTITDGTTYTFEDSSTDEPTAAIFSKDDLTIKGNGSLTVNANYNNGITSKDDLKITGGNISVTSVDDGLIGKDSITIKGGTIDINASGDGIDANGSIEMNDGTVIVNGPENSGNGALDYNSSFNINGGLFIAAGSSGMAQSPSTSSKQNSVNVFLSSQSANTLISIKNENGEDIVTFAPSKTYQSVIISSPSLQSNTKYTVYSGGTSTGNETDGLYTDGSVSGGSEVGSFTTSSTITTVGSGSGNIGAPGNMKGSDGGKVPRN